MTTILTSSTYLKGKHSVTAKAPSGKHCKITVPHPPLFNDHKQAALSLAAKIGLPDSLIHGETRDGFAFTPLLNPAPSLETVEKAARTLMQAATAFPQGEKDPIRLASGIMNLLKKSD